MIKEVEWSDSVTAAGSTRRRYGLGSAVGVLRGIITSSSREKSEVWATSWVSGMVSINGDDWGTLSPY